MVSRSPPHLTEPLPDSATTVGGAHRHASMPAERCRLLPHCHRAVSGLARNGARHARRAAGVEEQRGRLQGENDVRRCHRPGFRPCLKTARLLQCATLGSGAGRHHMGTADPGPSRGTLCRHTRTAGPPGACPHRIQAPTAQLLPWRPRLRCSRTVANPAQIDAGEGPARHVPSVA